MRFISFNINSVRARLHQLDAIIDRHNPDFIGLQETKVDDPQFPLEAIEAMGYHCIFHGQKSHYGVALLSKLPPLTVTKGFPSDTDEDQKRFVGGSYDVQGEIFHVYNGYYPQGDSLSHPTKFPAKEKFYTDLTAQMQAHDLSKEAVILMGDNNIAPADIDIGIGSDNQKRWLRTGKASFQPIEREWLATLTGLGFVDSHRFLKPDATELSWFDYRSRGFERDPRTGLRIDLILTSNFLTDSLKQSGIDYDIRAMEKPSDHAPCWLEVEL
ncbi:exodeoxyribonuclease III [uncultured Umboniibacter sp.]|uniref:exodeoxyribonuclease III n=1 Tax=uncultured Umboniibacter sp. TaxID=1798917 RepID=UPI002636B46D|nr:exodeoxyribonuclease III [uncultured Umboniibacter sp.]